MTVKLSPKAQWANWDWVCENRRLLTWGEYKTLSLGMRNTRLTLSENRRIRFGTGTREVALAFLQARQLLTDSQDTSVQWNQEPKMVTALKVEQEEERLYLDEISESLFQTDVDTPRSISPLSAISCEIPTTWHGPRSTQIEAINRPVIVPLLNLTDLAWNQNVISIPDERREPLIGGDFRQPVRSSPVVHLNIRDSAIAPAGITEYQERKNMMEPSIEVWKSTTVNICKEPTTQLAEEEERVMTISPHHLQEASATYTLTKPAEESRETPTQPMFFFFDPMIEVKMETSVPTKIAPTDCQDLSANSITPVQEIISTPTPVVLDARVYAVSPVTGKVNSWSAILWDAQEAEAKRTETQREVQLYQQRVGKFRYRAEKDELGFKCEWKQEGVLSSDSQEEETFTLQELNSSLSLVLKFREIFAEDKAQVINIDRVEALLVCLLSDAHMQLVDISWLITIRDLEKCIAMGDSDNILRNVAIIEDCLTDNRGGVKFTSHQITGG
jgi:hypothetical protein